MTNDGPHPCEPPPSMKHNVKLSLLSIRKKRRIVTTQR